MDRSQIIPRGHRYFTVVCVVLLALALLAAGCTSKDETKSSTSASQSAQPSQTVQAAAPGEGVQNGDLVEIEYTGTLANGSVFDSSKDRGPFQFIIGEGTAIVGFENQIKGMKTGQSKKFTLSPEEAYGQYDPSLIKSMPIDFIPNEEKGNITIGDTVTLFNGQAYFPAKIIAMNSTNVTFDLNSQLAGQTLTFDITLVNLTPAKEVEEMVKNLQQQQNQTVQVPVDASGKSQSSSSQQPATEKKSL